MPPRKGSSGSVASNRRCLFILLGIAVLSVLGIMTFVITSPSAPDDRIVLLPNSYHSGRSRGRSAVVKPTGLALDNAADRAVVPSLRAAGGAADDGIPSSGFTQGVNGVIIYLHGGRWHSYFIRHALPSLERYYLSCHPNQYPIRIFYEVISEKEMADIRLAVPSAREVVFEDVSRFWKTLPHGITEGQMQQWVAAMPSFQGRGYRLMCRFWAGLVWQLPSMSQYDYYWRLDTDSILKGPLTVDPFVEMQRNQCEYGYNRLKGENPHTFHHLKESFDRWADTPVAEGGGGMPLTGGGGDGEGAASARARISALIVDPKTNAYWGPMFYNNFELGTMRLKRDPIYAALFTYLDEREPYGILKYRWGDAPIHTLGVYSALKGRSDRMCNFTKAQVPYGHAVKRPPPLTEAGCKAAY